MHFGPPLNGKSLKDLSHSRALHYFREGIHTLKDMLNANSSILTPHLTQCHFVTPICYAKLEADILNLETFSPIWINYSSPIHIISLKGMNFEINYTQ